MTTGTSNLGTPTSVTLAQPGKVLVLVTGTFRISCVPTEACTRTFSAAVGGRTVPGAFAEVKGAANADVAQPVNVAGIITDVPAGTHAVQLRFGLSDGIEGFSYGSDVRVVAIALG